MVLFRRGSIKFANRGNTKGRMRAMQVVVAAVVGVVPFMVAIPAAFAGVGFSVTPTFPTDVTVGQTGLPASIQVLNGSTPPENAGNVTINAIHMVPACGTTGFVGAGDCPAASADPGVFSISSTGTGEVSTACAGQTFAIAIIAPATGQVSFTPSGGPVILTPPATANSVCRIDFTFNVLKAPTKNTGTITPNKVQTAQLGWASGTSAVDEATGTGSGSSFMTITKAAPGIITTATTSAQVGGSITDTAALSNAVPPGPSPTGSITFTLFTTAGCTGTPVFTSTVPVNRGPGSYTSGAFKTTAIGTYRWIARYSGDGSNAAAATACGEAGETTTVTNVPPALPVIGVTKAANPLSLPAPGGDFTFTVTVNNPSTTDALTITSLVDNVYGDLAAKAGSTCGSLVGVILQPGQTSAPCSFTGAFAGVTGNSQTDTVTAVGTDSHGLRATATAQATVSLTPAVTPTVPGSLAITGRESGGRNLMAAGLIVMALALFSVVRRRHRFTGRES